MKWRPWHQIKEGERAKQGLNIRKDSHSKIILIIFIWKFGFYFRIRDMSKFDKGVKKYLWSFHFIPFNITSDGQRIIRNFYYSFDTNTIKLNGKSITLELLDFIIRDTRYGK